MSNPVPCLQDKRAQLSRDVRQITNQQIRRAENSNDARKTRQIQLSSSQTKKMKTKITIGLLTALLTAGTALAAPTHPTFGTFVNSGAVPNGSKLVLNITLNVVNDLDSGICGNYWAVDNYNKQIKVWQVPDGTFYAVVRYAGKFTTIQGQQSPGDCTLTEGSVASGTFEGGYVATFTGTLIAPAFGNIGTVDYNDPLHFDWTTAYFTGFAAFDQTQWGWTYHYKSQTWNNFDSGTSGNIVVP
jgi:hypothetical protein